jgi:thymidylate kinase
MSEASENSALMAMSARPIVELVGLPGSGKSTIAEALIHSGRFISLRKALREAVGQWITSEVYKVRYVAPLFRNELFLRLYFARNIGNLRDSYELNPHVVRLVTDFVLYSGQEEGLHELRFAEAIATFLELLSRNHLLTHYASAQGDAVLADEHWIQLIAFVLNWGNESRWAAWSTEMLDHIPLPEKVIWLQGAAEMSHLRQIGRGRIAAMFHGSDDIAAMGSRLEYRADVIRSELENRGVRVIAVDARQSPQEVMDSILVAL